MAMPPSGPTPPLPGPAGPPPPSGATSPWPAAPPPPPPVPPVAPGQPASYYPQQAYYAPGWAAPAATAPRKRRRGIVLAIVAGVVAVALVVGGVVGVMFWMRTKPIGDVTSPVTATTRQVATGHCVAELPADGTVGTVRLVPCEEEHAAEVVGVLPLADDSWPGEQAVTDEVTQWCEMDADQLAGGFRAVVWTPSKGAWGQGDRDGVCLAWYDGGGVTGSWATGDVRTP